MATGSAPSRAAAEGSTAASPGLPAPGQGHHVNIGVLGAILIAVGVLIVAFIAHDGTDATRLSAGPSFPALGLADPSGRGLKVNSTLTRTDDSIVVAGDIVNRSEIPQPVPRLRLTLRDGNQGELDFKIIDPPVVELMPGKIAHFTYTFEHPSITTTGVTLKFTSE